MGSTWGDDRESCGEEGDHQPASNAARGCDDHQCRSEVREGSFGISAKDQPGGGHPENLGVVFAVRLCEADSNLVCLFRSLLVVRCELAFFFSNDSTVHQLSPHKMVQLSAVLYSPIQVHD